MNTVISNEKLATLDPEVFQAIESEKKRQQTHIELIASENFTLPAIMESCGSVLTNKYAEGYPGKRYYGGCEFVDIIEQLAIDRAKQVFNCGFANVQPHSGSQANTAVYLAFLKPGDTILTMSLEHGGHLTHGHPKNLSGMYFNVVSYGVNPETGYLDYEGLEAAARQHKPKMITIGASAYPRVIDFERVGKIAKEVGALLMADIAHIAGLVAAGLHPSPFPHADIVTTTTHKTLRGPRGGLILTDNEDTAKAINSAVFPGTQGGPLMHIIAGKATCFAEALKPSFKEYQKAVIRNTAVLAEELIKNGFAPVSKGTDNHLILCDLRPSHPDLTGKQAQAALEKANITTNKNTVPGETRSPFQASGLRLGGAPVTSRGMDEDAMRKIAEAITIILGAPEDEAAIAKGKAIALELCAKFPLPY